MATGREGLVPVEHEVSRGGATHTQRFWVRPEEARALLKKKIMAEAAQEVAKKSRLTEEYRLAHYGEARIGKVVKDAEGRVRVPGGRPWIEHDPSFPFEQSWHAHFEKGEDGFPISPDAGGQPTPERAVKHREIVERAFEFAEPTPDGAPRYAVLTMGAPASGKSSVIRDIVPKEGWVKVDPDSIKEQLPEYTHALEVSAEDAAPMVHEESSWLAKKIRDQAIAGGYPIMVDGTGVNPESFGKLIDKLHDNGYHVRVVMADLDKDEGLRRLFSRAEVTGRLPPPDYTAVAYDTIPGNFDAIAAKADGFRVVSTRGAGPEVVWSKDENGETIHNPERVAEFKARAHSQRLEAEARKPVPVSVARYDPAALRLMRSRPRSP